MISQVESFLWSYKQGTPEEGQRVQLLKHRISTYHNKEEDNSMKNYNQNNTEIAWLKCAFMNHYYFCNERVHIVIWYMISHPENGETESAHLTYNVVWV